MTPNTVTVQMIWFKLSKKKKKKTVPQNLFYYFQYPKFWMTILTTNIRAMIDSSLLIDSPEGFGWSTKAVAVAAAAAEEEEEKTLNYK